MHAVERAGGSGGDRRRPRPARRAGGPTGAGDGGAAGRGGVRARRRARRSSTSARTSSAGCGCECAAPQPGDGGHRPPRRGARARRARHPAAAHGEGDRHLPAGRRRRGGPRAARSRSTASATPRSTASSTWRPRTSRRSSSARTCAAPAGSTPPTSCSTASTRTSSGARAATSSTSRPTARSATSGSAGPATSRSSRPPPCFLFDTAGFLSSWLADLAADQKPDGSVPYVIPDALDTPEPTATGWGDAATIVPPWLSTSAPATRRCSSASSPSMRAWVDKIAALAGAGPAVDRRIPVRRLAGPDGAARPARQGAGRSRCRGHGLPRALGRPGRRGGEAARTARRRRRLRAAGGRGPRRVRARVRHRGRARAQRLPPPCTRWRSPWALLPTREQRDRAGARLADLVRAGGFRIGTGFLGTPLIADALTQAGHVDVAYRLLLQDGVPVVALPGDDGRDDGLGALGQHAPRRHDQPRPDDLVQPLRAGRGGRLAAPDRSRGSRRRRRATGGSASSRGRRAC